MLAERGRVLFIDEHVDDRDKETYSAGDSEIVLLRLLLDDLQAELDDPVYTQVGTT